MQDRKHYCTVLKREYDLTMESLNKYTGIKIKRLEDGSIFIKQENYIRDILEKFWMKETNPDCIPSEIGNQHWCKKIFQVEKCNKVWIEKPNISLTVVHNNCS